MSEYILIFERFKLLITQAFTTKYRGAINIEELKQ